MRQISEWEKEKLRAEVRDDFLGDVMLQEVHVVRALHQLQTEGMTPDELIAFYETGRGQVSSRRR